MPNQHQLRRAVPLRIVNLSELWFWASGEVATAGSCGCEPAEQAVTDRQSGEAATAKSFCCRRFAAGWLVANSFRTLTRAATCCRGFAAEILNGVARPVLWRSFDSSSQGCALSWHRVGPAGL